MSSDSANDCNSDGDDDINSGPNNINIRIRFNICNLLYLYSIFLSSHLSGLFIYTRPLPSLSSAFLLTCWPHSLFAERGLNPSTRQPLKPHGSTGTLTSNPMPHKSITKSFSTHPAAPVRYERDDDDEDNDDDPSDNETSRSKARREFDERWRKAHAYSNSKSSSSTSASMALVAPFLRFIRKNEDMLSKKVAHLSILLREAKGRYRIYFPLCFNFLSAKSCSFFNFIFICLVWLDSLAFRMTKSILSRYSDRVTSIPVTSLYSNIANYVSSDFCI